MRLTFQWAVRVGQIALPNLAGPHPNSGRPNTYSCAQLLSCIRIFETAWTIAHQAPLSLEFSRQEYWSRLPFPSPGHLPDPKIKPTSLAYSVMAGGCFTTSFTWEAPVKNDVLSSKRGFLVPDGLQTEVLAHPGP